MSSSKSSSPNLNQCDSFSPNSSFNTLSPGSSNSISSPDKSFLLNQTVHDEKQVSQQQSFPLIDYFVVAGLEKSSEVEPSAELSSEQVLNPFHCSYRCRVLNHYPNEVENNPFDEDAISRLSMPDGVSIRQHSPDPPSSHPFLITRLDGTRYYGVALTFFEQLNPFDETNASEISSYPAIASLNQLIETYLRSSSRIPSSRSSSSSSSSLIYVSKAICLISRQPHYSTLKRILELLYQMTIEHDLLGLPFEAHLYHLLHELYFPSPSLSHSVLRFSLGERQLTVWQPSIQDDDLPLLDFNLLDLFSLLGVSGVVDLVTCALLEHQIILKSSDYNRLMLVAECLTSLLFPFQWTLLYVPIVFTAALVCLDVPVPAIMGLRIKRTNENSDSITNHRDVVDDDDENSSNLSDEGTFEVQRCVVHIDLGQIQLPDDMPRFPDRSKFIEELNEILSRFDQLIREDLQRTNSTRTRKSEDWTHVDDEHPTDHQPSQALSRLAAIAKRTGIVTDHSMQNETKLEPLFTQTELLQISAKNCLRAAFVNRFAQLFCQMDAFICYPSPGKYANLDQWLAQRSTTKNFDRTMFIADQPKPHVPFLLAFMETQSFVSFVDSKIAAKFNEDHQFFGLSQKHLQYFSERIRSYRDRRDSGYQKCPLIDRIDEETRRLFTPPFPPSLIVVHSPPVRPLMNTFNLSKSPYLFENLNGALLESSSSSSSSASSSSILSNSSSPLSLSLAKRNSRLTRSFQSKHVARRVTRVKKQQTVNTGEHQLPVVLVENEVVFQQLLKECTTKTKRMVIEKMTDVVQGSSAMKNLDSSSMVNLEENVLIAGFCDLLERIWSHGLHHKPNGKSALWNHIKCFVKLKNYESAQVSHEGIPINLSKDENPALVWCVMRKQLVNRSSSTSRSQSPSTHRSHTLPRSLMSAHPTKSSPLLAMTNSTLNLISSENHSKPSGSTISLLHDYKSICSCFGNTHGSISASEIGFARAFVRLALERRLLSRHLSELFSQTDLLQALYKRDSFLRADDGDLRKQFLAHVESLQLLDYHCFSNSYADIDIIYHVAIVPTRTRATGIASTTTANPYVALSGLLGSTKVISLPSKNSLEMKIKHKNLGQLTTLRIGHDNSGLMPRWNVDYVSVRNELTNNVYRFPCGRWLGKGVDDDSLERVLFVESVIPYESSDNSQNGSTESGSPSQLMTSSFMTGGSQTNLSVVGRSRSPSLRRPNNETKNPSNQQADDIYELLGRSINQLVKYFDEPEKKRGLLTPILCGEEGLVNALEKTLSYGFKRSTGNVPFFGSGRKRYIWDFLIKVCDEYDGRRSKWIQTKMEKAIICYINGVRSIEKALSTFGKDGRFQSWCCLACKLHLLSDWFKLLSQCSDACLIQFYDPVNNCFRQEKLNQFIINILEPVKDFDFAHLEPALLKGLAGL